MAAAFADLPEALANTVAIAQRCNLTIPLGKNYLARLSDAARRHARRAPARRGGGRARASARRAVSGCAGARREARRIRRAARVRDEDHRPDGLRRLLPDRRRLHQLGEGQRRAGRTGSRLGRRLARRVRARHHRPRSAALRAAVRALPQPRARVDAGLRHRLLPGRARPRHRLRQEEVRRRLGLADRDLRHDGREGGGARRRPRARSPVPLLRRHREADPVPAGQAHHAEGGAGDGAAPRRARAEGGGGARAARARRVARGAHAQRRHARRRRADRAGQAHRLLPALHAARVRRDRLAVRQGRRRGGRPRQVRLPRPHHAHDPRLDAALREAPRSGERAQARDAPARRPGRVRHLQDGQHRGGVPVRIARHARPHETGAADPVRGRHRAGRALSAGTDGTDPGLHRAQDRPRARRVPGSAARADPRSHVRRDGVPGAGDADRAGDRRLHAGRRRPAAPRDGQEEPGGDGEAPRRLHRRRREERPSPSQGRCVLRPDGEVRRLRLQQVARGGLCAHRLPDRLLQGAPPGSLHGRQPLAGDGRHRQGARPLRRRGRERPRDPAARRQRVELPLRADRRAAHPLRPRRDQGHRRAGDRGDRRGARRRAGRSSTCSTSAGASTSGSSTAAPSRR